jgi:hypothetical protein
MIYPGGPSSLTVPISPLRLNPHLRRPNRLGRQWHLCWNHCQSARMKQKGRLRTYSARPGFALARQRGLHMRKLWPLFSVFALTAVMAAQINIPAGTVISVELSSSIDAKKCKPGQKFTARVAQDVPLYNGAKIKAGSRIRGSPIQPEPVRTQQQPPASNDSNVPSRRDPTPGPIVHSAIQKKYSRSHPPR